jgi:protein gp37
MGRTTGIEWTDSTWNPIRGCSRVSEGCRNCYAERTAARFSGKGQPYEGLAEIKHIRRPNGQTETTEARWTGAVQFVEKHLHDPLRWKAPKKIFVNSMSDLFHEAVTVHQVYQIFMVMWAAHWHTFQVLTKRPERMFSLVSAWLKADIALMKAFAPDALPGGGGIPRDSEPLSNVWFGVSVENQETANYRIPILLKTPAQVRFVSYEPALGPVDFSQIRYPDHPDISMLPLNRVVPPHLDWVICGGESGSFGRPMHPDWARTVRDQCQRADIPFFFKQWGEWAPEGPIDYRQCAVSDGGKVVEPVVIEEFPKWCDDSNWQVMYRVGKSAAGSALDGVEWKESPKGGNK